jgi:hypothetical protein
VNLFESLEKAGISSPLISHFAQSKRRDKAYCDVRSDKTLFVKSRFLSHKHDMKSKIEASNLLTIQYRLSGGMSTFHNIIEYDPDLFPNILKSIDKKLCKITRLDMCIDLSSDIMGLVSENVKKGRVNSFGSHLRGYGVLNGKPFSNEFVGRRSKFYKNFKDDSCKLTLETLYCGHRKETPCVLVFYDKELKSRKRHVAHLAATRVEIRLYSGKDDRYSFIIRKLLESITYKEKMGQFLRHILFTQLLFLHIHFSSVQRGSKFFNSLTNWCSWWQELFQVNFKACLVEKSDFIPLLPKILDDLSTFKSTPSNILNLYYEQLRKLQSGVNHATFNFSPKQSSDFSFPCRSALRAFQ